jgi:hypothetical protein
MKTKSPMKTFHMLALVASSLIAVSCSKEAPAESAPSGASSEHAPAAARPGSHEDWCGEHQVPESMCTRCNPSLIPAFKATNDWCAEHGLPESQCLKCNPDLKIVRPPAGQ